MSRVLIVYYSQTRQSQRIAEQLQAHYGPDKSSLLCLQAQQDFEFPWRINSFFSQMPLCVENVGCPIKNFDTQLIAQAEKIILVHPVWFLSPSLPMQGFLKLAQEQGFLRGKKVLQIITCRNMWFCAAKKTCDALLESGADYRGHLILRDPHPNWASLVTTPRWMFLGKTNAFSIFPAAGLGEKVFNTFEREGPAQIELLFASKNPSLLNKAFDRSDSISLCMESFGHRFLFKPWAKLILSAPQTFKNILILAFRLNLIVCILVLMPFYELVSSIYPAPFLSSARKQQLSLTGEAA